MELGRNRIRDGQVFPYRHLNSWFHYRFFNGIAWVVNSAEACTLLPRLWCLERHLWDAMQTRTVHSYLEQDLGIGESDRVLENILEAIQRMAVICQSHPIFVWGVKTDDSNVQAHSAYVETVSRSPAEIVFGLPHIRRLKYSWDAALKAEEKELGKAVSRYNRWKKHRRRLPVRGR